MAKIICHSFNEKPFKDSQEAYMDSKKLNNDLNAGDLPVIKLTDEVPHISFENLNKLSESSKKVNLARSRICAHQNENEKLQNMFIYFNGKSQVEPAKHIDKDESIHMLWGRGRYFFFNESDDIDFDIRLGDYSSDLPFYLRVPKNVMHCLVSISENILAHETTQGPFNPSLTQYQNNRHKHEAESVRLEYSNELAYLPVHPIEPLATMRVSENEFQCKGKYIYIRRADIEEMKREALFLRKKIIRVIIAPSDEGVGGLIEEMVIYAEKNSSDYKNQNSHDRAFHVIEGAAKFVIYDEHGSIKKEIFLSDKDHMNIFVRIPKKVPYSMVKTSDILVMHESSVI